MKKIFLLGSLFYCTVLKSQTVIEKDSSITNLNEVILTTKIKQSSLNIAHNVASLSLAKQNSKGLNTLHNILNTVSGVYMVDMGNEQLAMSIRLPINYSPLYNYLEDGIPLRPVGIFNNNELLELNRFSLQKIEVVKGPYSSSYGAHSIGASVNFIQKRFDNATNSITLQSNGFGHTEAVLQFKKKIGSWRFTTNFNHSQRRVNNDFHFNYTKDAFTLNAEKIINAKNTLNFTHNTILYNGDQRDGYDSASFYAKKYNSFDKFSDRKTLAIRNSFTWKHTLNDLNSLTFKLFNRVLIEKQNPFYLISYDYSNPLATNATGQITRDRFVSMGLSIEHNTRSKNNKFRTNQNIYLDFTPKNIYTSNFINVTRNNGVNESFTNPDSLLTNYRANLKNIAFGSSLQYLPTEKIILSAGIRADVLRYNFQNFLPPSAYSGSPSSTNTYYGLNPEISFLYKLSKFQSMFIQFGRGFVPPTLSNLYRGVKTPILLPATYSNTEIGYKLARNNISLSVSLYNMIGKDEFVSVIRNTGVVVVNAGKTSHKGIELQFRYAYKNLEIEFSPSMHKHKFKDYTDFGVNYSGNNINGAPTYLQNLSVSYLLKVFQDVKFTAEWSKVGPYFINQSNTKKYEGYNLLNLKSTINFKKVFINIGVNNILNTVYATNADGTYGIRYYPGIKRTFQTGITYSF